MLTISIELTEDQMNYLNNFSEASGLSKDEIIRRALDCYRGFDGQQRMDFEDVKRKLDIYSPANDE